MKARMKAWWDKYESWLAPITVVVFLALGIQIGILLGRNLAQKEFNDQVAGLNSVITDQNGRIAAKDLTITDKDQRLRTMQDLQLSQGKDVAKALIDSSEAAKSSAASAKSSAESAKAVINESPKAATP